MENFIKGNIISILYFSGSDCSACEVIKRKIDRIISQYSEVGIKEINALKEKEVAAQLNVFTLPLVIVYIDGKESYRYGRNINILEFKSLIDRFYNLIYK